MCGRAGILGQPTIHRPERRSAKAALRRLNHSKHPQHPHRQQTGSKRAAQWVVSSFPFCQLHLEFVYQMLRAFLSFSWCWLPYLVQKNLQTARGKGTPCQSPRCRTDVAGCTAALTGRAERKKERSKTRMVHRRRHCSASATFSHPIDLGGTGNLTLCSA
jgi:hypothetical protein